MKPTFTEQHVNHSLQDDKPSNHVKDNDNSCTCNAGEKSVRFNLPTKTRASTTRNESQKSNENSCKHSGGHYQRKGHGNSYKGGCKEPQQVSCTNGKLRIFLYILMSISDNKIKIIIEDIF